MNTLVYNINMIKYQVITAKRGVVAYSDTSNLIPLPHPPAHPHQSVLEWSGIPFLFEQHRLRLKHHEEGPKKHGLQKKGPETT